MSSKNSATKRGTPRRRKIALACEACRDKKIRCDGVKPICGPCARRSYTIDQCVFKLENARSASNDAYLKVLHDRIRELEETCIRNGISVSRAPSQSFDGENTRGPAEAQKITEAMDSESRKSEAVEGLLGLGSGVDFSHLQPACSSSRPSQPDLVQQRLGNSGQLDQLSPSRVGHERTTPLGNLDQLNSAQSFAVDATQSPSLNSHGNVTAMGAISVAEDGECTDSPRHQYYGNSSVASFMRLAGESMPIQSYMQALKRAGADTPGASYRDTGLWRDINFPTLGLQFDDFSLPPRSLADHLLECYWDRVYCLYPFFHRPSFEQAYENLWGSNKWPKPQLPELNIGLGGSFDSGPQSIVFHCALNAIFALGCHFSDIPATERETAAYSFFLRAKRFVGLDLLDTGTIGVVQTLLVIALLLQSTPYPNRCWNSIGVACRVAQGLGLHETVTQLSVKPLEKEIRQRTWHGCVILDLIVSMTYGRPSMVSHISPVPLPVMRPQSQSDDPCRLSGQGCDHDLGYMIFYVSTIKLYKILESILSDIYNAWQSRSDHRRPMSPRRAKQNSLDLIMELDDRLSSYETSVPTILNWCIPHAFTSEHINQRSIFKRQQNVLRARFIHLRLLLYRPMFTQLCSEERTGLARQPSTNATPQTSRPGKNAIYFSMSVNCASACVTAAMDLVLLVYETYRTAFTDAWWYNGFYTSTAGFVLIMSYSCRSILNQIDAHAVDEAWGKCEEILTNMASFSPSARNSLQFLQVTYQHIIQNYSASTPNDDDSMRGPTQTQQRDSESPTRLDQSNQPANGDMQDLSSRDPDMSRPSINPFMNWDEMGLGQEEFGFLGRFDLPDLASWFSDVPDIP
ncbi:hypothetical protein N7462_009997 [Penicillium macrosclerotiorum]|uniref:uncharacterized protein n=1 Tax=Penicillium macrosclerotiorum TaxID=303699 RepID=UPI00254741D9|nr:uncharacterized protein N7462_009997 [Penicillium macrosclerotiorum]KAJ5668927.1 hypothetical protein N7462_009997 [Penicillium macrosclerotiorum]